MTTIAAGASATLTVTDGATVTLVSNPNDSARLTVTTGANAGSVVVSQHAGRKRYGPFGAGTLTLQAVSGYCTYYISTDGADDAERVITAVTLDATDLTGLNTAGKPIATGVFLKDPTTKLVYGQSDGAGSYEALGGGSSTDAADIDITDAGAYFTGTTVEAALQESATAKVTTGSGAPSGGVDGQGYIRSDKPLAGVPYLRSAGTWAALNNSYTWAGRPTASSYSGAVILITDWGQEFYSDGTNWIPVGKRVQLICSAAAGATITSPTRAASHTDTDLIPAGLILPNCWVWGYSSWILVGTVGPKNCGMAIGATVIAEPPAAGGNSWLSLPVSSTFFVLATSGSNNIQLPMATTAANALQSSNSAAPVKATLDLTVANSVTWNSTTTSTDTAQCIGRRLEIYYP